MTDRDANRLLLRGGRVITMVPGDEAARTADILIEDGAIVAVAPDIQADTDETIDASGMIVLPGFVDTHRHVWQTQLRTLATDYTLFNYTTRIRLGYSACYTAEDAYLGNFAGALEAISAGVTTVVDHCHIMNSPEHADAALQGLLDAGIRATFCYGLFPNPSHHPFRHSFNPGWRFDDARRIRREKLAADTGLVRFGLAPAEIEKSEFSNACSEIRFGRELGAHLISGHVAMGAYSIAFGEPVRFVERLAGEGFLAEDLVLVHGAALTDEELALIRRSGASVSVTPETELQMGMGHPVAARAVAAGVKTGLGIDVVSNYSGDMLTQMRLLLQSERSMRNARMAASNTVPRVQTIDAREVLEMATRGGAEAARLDDVVGTVAPGRRADLVLVRCDSLNMAPAVDPVGAVVLNANASDVDTVLIDGRILKRDGRLTRAATAHLAHELKSSRERLDTAYRGLSISDMEAVYAGRYNFGN